ncbi:MAG: NAD(P)H-dependent oxidoreductase subunit E [Bacteroidales bacterium]|nr:NAD(P)H-dependent oxidoreductase subunit E [Bacteroidales bacterium]
MTKKSRDIKDKYKLSDRNKLMPILQEIQDEEGYISEQAIRELGEALNISTTSIYSVASFYDGFRFVPQGRVHIRLCNGTACYINRLLNIPAIIKEELKLGEADRSADGRFSIEMVDCMGACHLGPLVAVNDRYYTVHSENELRRIIKKIQADGQMA